MSLFLSCGEASGDHYAGRLIEAVKSKVAPVWGMFGPEGTMAGGHALWGLEELQVMGISEAFREIPRLMRLKNAMADRVLSEMPSCVVVIDSPDYHIPLIKALRKRGYAKPVFYVSPPTAWAWRRGRAAALRDLKVVCLPLFEMEHLFYKQRGVESHWTGHPLLDDLSGYVPEERVLKNTDASPIAALLPGSRPSETRRLAPVLRDAGLVLQEMGYHPVISIAKNLSAQDRGMIKSICHPLTFFEGKGVDLISQSEFVVGACGTAAVEAMMFDKFMVVLYKASLLSYIVFKVMVKTKWVSMPNVLLGREVYPEFLQSKANVGAIKRAICMYLDNSAKIHKDLLEAKSKMGRRGAYRLWADVILERVER